MNDDHRTTREEPTDAGQAESSDEAITSQEDSVFNEDTAADKGAVSGDVPVAEDTVIPRAGTPVSEEGGFSGESVAAAESAPTEATTVSSTDPERAGIDEEDVPVAEEGTVFEQATVLEANVPGAQGALDEESEVLENLAARESAAAEAKAIPITDSEADIVSEEGAVREESEVSGDASVAEERVDLEAAVPISDESELSEEGVISEESEGSEHVPVAEEREVSEFDAPLSENSEIPEDTHAPEDDAAAGVSRISVEELRRKRTRYQGIEPGHRACLGCGEALAARLVTEAAGPDVILANATGCLEIFTTPWPESAWRLPWLHSLFENTGAVAAGMEAALKAQGKSTKVLAFGGDGGTFDIGFQALSGMLERGHNVLYVCYDNEAYMNTGIQRSSSTPHAAMTTTSPPGKERMGKRHLKKDIISIISAHHIPYAAATSVAYPSDVRKKVRRALAIDGPTFLLIHSPCPLGWGHDGALSIEVARLAVQTGLFPLIELERGELIGAMPIRHPRPVTDYLKLQQRFRHLFQDDLRAKKELEHLQALADHNIEYYGLRSDRSDALDTDGADTVRRGGMRWA